MVFSDVELEFGVFLTFLLGFDFVGSGLEKEEGTAVSTLLWREALDASP